MSIIGHCERTHVVRGVEISYPDKIYPGYEFPDWKNNPTGDRNGPMRRQEPRVIYPAGTVFVPENLLDELCEADNSWGCGGAFLINDPRVEWALECEGLIHVETKGGVYTDKQQRKRIRALLKEQ